MEDDGIQMLGEIAIGDRGDRVYKYLGMLKSYQIKNKEMRLKVILL